MVRAVVHYSTAHLCAAFLAAATAASSSSTAVRGRVRTTAAAAAAATVVAAARRLLWASHSTPLGTATVRPRCRVRLPLRSTDNQPSTARVARELHRLAVHCRPILDARQQQGVFCCRCCLLPLLLLRSRPKYSCTMHRAQCLPHSCGCECACQADVLCTSRSAGS